jgi:hypothetical protein
MSRAARDLLTGVSLANLCFIGAWKEILDLAGPTGYYLDPSPSAIWALLADVVLVGLACAGAVIACRRLHGPVPLRVARVAFLLALLLPLGTLRTEFRLWRVGELITWIGRPDGQPFPWNDLWPLLLLAVFAGWRARSVRVARAVVLFFAPFIAVTFGRALWLAATVSLATAFAEQPLAAPLVRPEHASERVIVLVFDEMDYRMAFVDRPAGLTLPALDRLQAEALAAGHATPPAWETALSLPALLTGSAISDARPAGPSTLSVRFVSDSGSPATWRDWRQLPTVFTRARAIGVNAALVGWYHPYCRVVALALTRCAAEPYFGVINRAKHEGLVATMGRQLRSLWPWDPQRRHIESYRRIRVAALDAATDPGLGIVFIHWPVPHHPYVYDAAHRRFTSQRYGWTGYLEHLRLVDETVAEVRAALEGAGLWARTALIVTSDHAARVKDRPERGVRRDERVPFIVRLPRQGDRVVYDRPFSIVVLSDLVLAILRGEVARGDQLSHWLDRHAPDPHVQHR